LLEHDLGLVEAQLHFGTIFLKSLLSISFLTFRTLRYRICILSRIHISPVHGTQLWFIATNARFQRPQITQFYIFFLERLQIPFVGLPISFPQLNTDKRVTKPCLDFLQSKSMVLEADVRNVPALQNMVDTSYIPGFTASYNNLKRTEPDLLPSEEFSQSLWDLRVQMHTEVQVSPELHQRITDNASKCKAALIEIIPTDTNVQSYDAFRESLTGNNAEMYKVLMENLTTTARADSTLQNSLTKLQESYHSDAIVGKMSNPNNTRQRQDFISQASSLANSWSSVIPWSPELKITPTQYDVLFSKALGVKTAMGQTLNRMNIRCRCRSNAVLDEYDEHLMICSR